MLIFPSIYCSVLVRYCTVMDSVGNQLAFEYPPFPPKKETLELP